MSWRRTAAIGFVAFGALALGALALAGCTRTPVDPEDEIRAFLRRAEQAARDKDLGAIGGMVADDYRDEESRTKRDLVGFVGYHFMRQGSLHVATRLRKATFPAKDSAKAQVLAAMGRADFDWTKLPEIDADIQFVDLDLRRDDGEWQVTRAAWRPATADDL